MLEIADTVPTASNTTSKSFCSAATVVTATAGPTGFADDAAELTADAAGDTPPDDPPQPLKAVNTPNTMTVQKGIPNEVVFMGKDY